MNCFWDYKFSDTPGFVETLENNLNCNAEKNNGLALTVPMAFVEGEKI